MTAVTHETVTFSIRFFIKSAFLQNLLISKYSVDWKLLLNLIRFKIYFVLLYYILYSCLFSKDIMIIIITILKIIQSYRANYEIKSIVSIDSLTIFNPVASEQP